MLIEYRLKLVVLLIKHFVDYQYPKRDCTRRKTRTKIPTLEGADQE
jgi:hypothetical protein